MLGKFWGLGLAVVLLLVLASGAQAQGLKMEITPLTLTTYGNGSASFQINLKNTGKMIEEFVISVAGKSGWVNLERYYLKLLSQEEAEVGLVISPMDEVGAYSFEVTTISLTNPDLKETKTVYISVLPQEQRPVTLEGFEMKRDGDVLTFNVGINYAVRGVSKEVVVEFAVRDSEGDLVIKDSAAQDVTGLEILSKDITLPEGLLAGNYNVKVSVEDTDLVQTASFSIEAVRDVRKTKTVTSNPLFEETVITVNNQGNVVVEGYTVTEVIPGSVILNLVTPGRCIQVDDDRECAWVIDSILPDGKKSIVYRVEYWPIILIWVIIADVIVLVAVGTARKAVKPVLKKKVVKKGKGKYTVVLEVKNPFYHTLNNVLIRDLVSPLARVEKEFRGVKPVMRRSRAGTELIWRLGGIKPREERLVHYSVKTVVEGQLKVPKAYIKYTTQKGAKDKVFSKGLVIEG